jgi:glycosyltransferase involved in cell wall biosynthesis
LPIPFIRGPGGGTNRVPRSLLREYTIRGRLWEYIREVARWVLQHDPFFVLGQRRARAILICNRESMKRLPLKWRPKAVTFPVNGVTSTDLALQASSATDGVKGKFKVLTAGRLTRPKGFTLALKAFSKFVEKNPESTLEIVGDGPDQSYLVDLVKRYQLEAQVRFRAWMPRQDLLAEMAGSDVFLFPSLRDGGGAVVVEALAAGTPVVCLDLGGPGLHVTDECGIKVVPESHAQTIQQLALALSRLYSDPSLCQTLGIAARRRAETLYRWDRLGERLMEIYERALGDQTFRSHH